MKIKIRLDIHAYAEEKLCDNQLEPPDYGLHGPEIVKPYADKRNSVLEYEYSNKTCIADIVDYIENLIWGDNQNEIIVRGVYSFLFEENRYYIDNPSANFSNILETYLDPQKTGMIICSILINCNAGMVAEDGKLRFWVNSKESGKHNVAHVHVRDVGYQYEASIRISDGEIIAGKLPRKLARQAKEKILEDQDYFIKCWNTLTDGLQVDINRHYNYIKY